MSDEAYWADLRPILNDLADRIARIEQLLAASGLAASGFAATGPGPGNAFDAAPASFGAPPTFGTPAPINAGPAGTSPFGGPQSGIVPDDILMLARSKKIQAIAELRQRTGMSLKQAKDIIDQALRGY